jgi:endoglucanase
MLTAAVFGVALAVGGTWGAASGANAAATPAMVVPPPVPIPDAGVAFPLHTSAIAILDADGHSLRLHCANWSGAENGGFVPGGLNQQLDTTIISEIAGDGFNCVRLPWSNQMWDTDPKPSGNTILANPQFAGLGSKEIFEDVVKDIASAGIMIILDNHESEAGNCCNTSDSDASWYDPSSSTYTSANWIADWKSVTAAFDSIPQVIGVDLRNEPRGSSVTWGPSGTYDWHAAAEAGGDAVQSIDSNMLIFVEGTNFASDLSGVLSLPVVLSHPDHVVYEAHTYDFPPDYPALTDYDQTVANMQDFTDLYNKVPLWLGEFGCFASPGTEQDSCTDSSGDLGAWFGPLLRYIYYHNTSWSYWALNGPTTTTGGRPYSVLNYTWDGLFNPYLDDALASIPQTCPANAVVDGTYYLKNVHSGLALTVPGGSTTQGTDLDQETLTTGSASQEWKLDALGCSLYEITNVATGQSIDISGQSTGDGAAVDEYDYWGGGNQQFVIAGDGNGSSVTISAINSMTSLTGAFPLEIPGSSAASGTHLDQWPGNSGANQEWDLVSV